MAGPVSGDPAPQRPELVGQERIAPRWGVSSLDWRSHAIDEDTDHPSRAANVHGRQPV